LCAGRGNHLRALGAVWFTRPRIIPRLYNYDHTAIPLSYDRGHDHGQAVLNLWMDEVAAHVAPSPIRRIVDLACGTGRFAASLADRFHATVIGIDPSLGMLAHAKPKRSRDGDILLVSGLGEHLPLASRSVDLIFMSMVFHHFPDPSVVAAECARVLRPGGFVCVRAITVERSPHYPYVPFFPGSEALLTARLPTVAAMCAAFEASALHTRATRVVMQEIAPDYRAYADKLAAGADTTLALLPPHEFDAGLVAMRAAHHDARPAVPVVEPIDFMVFQKPEGDS
jgi:ubiquinone/menaquinone biosynthesis C-methylase UbiE